MLLLLLLYVHWQGAKIGYLPQGDLLLEQQQMQDQQVSLNGMTVLQAVLASDNETARAVQV
jgi:hypothetical protein